MLESRQFVSSSSSKREKVCPNFRSNLSTVSHYFKVDGKSIWEIWGRKKSETKKKILRKENWQKSIVEVQQRWLIDLS